MKILGKMWLMIILKVTTNQGLTLPLEDTFFKKLEGSRVFGLKIHSDFKILIEKHIKNARKMKTASAV